MTPDQAFQIANLLVLPQWLLMVVAPRWRVTLWLVRSFIIPVLLAVLYALYLFDGGPIDFAAFGTLDGIKGLFRNGGDGVMLAGWIHYLAFDLVAGSVVLRDAQEKEIPHWLIIVPLLFCFMLGPIGLLLYCLIRTIRLPGTVLSPEK
ncbi:ABA4-like family protein [Telluribacter humicola]|uniref:ABA4-like family protein n=1 Tax=Telluribacter humicola TaxID=1720261 RepID=UPI001A976517|nr:ABA4-like family protein [Telluribacter humicola]